VLKKTNFSELQATDSQISREIYANQVKAWPKKKKISFGKLSVKYAILNRIAAVNWVPTTHSSDVATGIRRFIYAIGTKTKMDFGAYIFEQTMRHAKTDAIKFSIAFPTLIFNIILNQHPNIKNVKDIPAKRESPLTLHQKLFGADHVPDSVGTSESAPAAGTMTKQEIVKALKDTCVLLDERKAQFELMIHSLEGEIQLPKNRRKMKKQMKQTMGMKTTRKIQIAVMELLNDFFLWAMP
jgi:hypothetical protein